MKGCVTSKKFFEWLRNLKFAKNSFTDMCKIILVSKWKRQFSLFMLSSFLWPKSTLSSIGLLKKFKLLNFCTATAQKKSFRYFCILTQKRGIGSKKVISVFLLPPNKVEAERIIFLPRFFHSHMFGLDWNNGSGIFVKLG